MIDTLPTEARLILGSFSAITKHQAQSPMPARFILRINRGGFELQGFFVIALPETRATSV